MQENLFFIEEITLVNQDYWRMKFRAPAIARVAQAGQFVHVLPGDTLSFAPLLRRAFSILNVNDESVEILFRVGGPGTRLLAQKRAGDSVDALGPLGRAFPVREGMKILVGGGVGVPPLFMLAHQQFKKGGSDSIQAIIGGRTHADVLCVEDFSAIGISPIIVTNDGSAGTKGVVTQPLEAILSALDTNVEAQKTDARLLESDTEFYDSETMFHVKHTVYACGPLPMLAAVAALCARYQVACIVSLEENMPCGIGVCNGCVVPVAGDVLLHGAKNPGDEYELFRRVCTEGPGMWAHEIDWAAFS